MDVPYILPQLCRETGLSCHDCTDSTATNLAIVCRGLQPSAVGRLFVQLYPHAACSPMQDHFRKAYEQALKGVELESPRRSAGKVGQTGIAAVA